MPLGGRARRCAAGDRSDSYGGLIPSGDFAAYIVGRMSSVTAYGIEEAAVAWQIFALRHNPFDLGLVGLVLFVPQLVLAIPAGLLADHYDRRAVCIVAAIGEALGLCGFLVLVLLHVRTVGIFLAAVGAVGTAHSFVIPAQRSLLANIVAPERFVRAQASTSSLAQALQVIAPAVAGILLAVGIPIAFAVAAVTYVVSAVGYGALRPRAALRANPSMGAALDGLRFIFSHKVILGAISLDLFAVLFGGATALLPVYATKILMVGPTGFGVLRAAPGVGAMIVAAYIARRPIHRRAGLLLFVSVAMFGIFTIVFGLSRTFIVSVVALVLIGGFDMVSVVIRLALVQLGTPDPMRGRVGAVENVFIGASNELGAFESGALASLIGTMNSVVAGGAATIVVIVLCFLVFPQLRRYDRLHRA